jgi:hypothetical protein
MTKQSRSTSYSLSKDVEDQLKYLCEKFGIKNHSRMISKLIMERHAIIKMIEHDTQMTMLAKAATVVPSS